MVPPELTTLCLFELAGVTYALPSAQVQEFVRMVAITPLPSAPSVIAGFINLRTEIIAVVNLRQRFNLPPEPAKLSDFLLIAQTPKRKIALWVDNALGVQKLKIKSITEPEKLTPHTRYLTGVIEAETDNGSRVILVHDLTTLLTDAENNSLQQTLSGEVYT